MKRLLLNFFLLGSTSLFAQSLAPISYQNPDLTVDLGVGLWAWPMPMDYDQDGDLDLIVSCPDNQAIQKRMQRREVENSF